MRSLSRLALVSLAAVAAAASACAGSPLHGLATAAGEGTLVIAVRWPETAYRAQVIPTDTTEVDVQVSQNGYLLQQIGPLTRSGGTASKNITLAAGIYTVSATAYHSGTVTAQGSTTASVLADQTVAAPLTMTGTYVPTLSTYTLSGGYGADVQLSGNNFDWDGDPGDPSDPGDTLGVSFNGTAATVTSVTNDTQAFATVPAGATNGDLVLTADGVSSTGSYPFTVIKSIAINTSPATTSIAFYGWNGGTPEQITLPIAELDTNLTPLAGGWNILASEATSSGAVQFSYSNQNVTISEKSGHTIGTNPLTGTFVFQAGQGSTVQVTVPYVLNP